MADGRIVNKSISSSEQVADLTLKAQLLFTWMIPHADDFGLLPSSSRRIKALVIPMNDEISSQDVESCLGEMLDSKLIKEIEWNGEKFYYMTGFSIQKLRKDIKPHCIARNVSDWKQFDEVTKQSVTDTERLDSAQSESVEEEKVREVKGSEENLDYGGKRPENQNEMSSIGSVLSRNTEKKTNGISTEWQDKAFRHFEGLDWHVSDRDKGRVLRSYKEEAQGKVFKASTERIYSYLKDLMVWKSMSDGSKLKFWFWIRANGLRSYQEFLKAG